MPITFPDVSKAAWLAKVAQDLKGKSLADLDFTVEGERLSPFWHREDLPDPPEPLAQDGHWKIGVQIIEQDIASANRMALEALRGGAESLWFSFYRPKSDAQKKALLEGIITDIVDIVIDEEETESSRGSVAYDLRHAVKYPERVPTFFLTASQDFYHTLAYGRATRSCWQLAAASLGVTTPCQLTTFLPKLSGGNVHLNKISSTVAAVAAICGGADTLYIAPSEGTASAFSRRIARNVHHLLREEAYLGRVADPAAGSYYLENLTDLYARKIWADFQKINGRT